MGRREVATRTLYVYAALFYYLRKKLVLAIIHITVLIKGGGFDIFS
jgi:hypothetical protein